MCLAPAMRGLEALLVDQTAGRRGENGTRATQCGRVESAVVGCRCCSDCLLQTDVLVQRSVCGNKGVLLCLASPTHPQA